MNPVVLRIMSEKLAQVAHETNNAYRTVMLGLPAKCWDELTPEEKTGITYAAEKAVLDPKLKPKDAHESWLQMKLAQGWVYGTAENRDAKQHPCMVEWDLLPDDRKVQDALFIVVCRTTAKWLM